GIVLVVGALRGDLPRLPFGLQGALLLVGGVLALVLSTAGVAVLLVLMSALFGVTGIVELVTGLRARGRTAEARDWVFLGGVSVAVAAAVLRVPVDLISVSTTPDAILPHLTASIMIVGMLGAYAAIAAVYLVIAGVSLTSASKTTPVTE